MYCPENGKNEQGKDCEDRMWAANICSPGFREHWIDEVKTNIIVSETNTLNYRGLWLDYVDMTLSRISISEGITNTPIYDHIDQAVTEVAWRDFVAGFTEQIADEIWNHRPGTEIIHNVLWTHEFPPDNAALREIRSANYVTLERGVHDRGLDTERDFDDFLSFIDIVHDQSRGVLFRIGRDSDISNSVEREYGLAAWLLISTGNDGFASNPYSTPDDWWRGYELNLKGALGYYEPLNEPLDQVISRAFECGVVLVNKPGTSTVTVPLTETYATIDGQQVTGAVTLGPTTGAILLMPCATFQHKH